jgi:hypothetical protein
MARGRFVSSSISTSRKFERLATNNHRLAYLMLIPHVDCEGRHAADARILSGQVYTLLDLTRAQIDAAIRDLHDVGLIRLYEVEGEPFLELVDFHEHNKVRRGPDGQPTHEAPSRIPPSSDGHAIAAPTSERRSNDVAATAEGLRVKGKEPSVKSEGEDLSSATPTRADKYLPFIDAWNWHRGVLPACELFDDKRRAGVDRLLKEFGDTALSRFEAAVQNVADDPYWQQKNYNIDNLLVRGRVLEKSDKHKANRGMSAGDRKLATTAATIARAIGGLDA